MLIGIIYAIISVRVNIKNYIGVGMKTFIGRIRSKRNPKERLYIVSIFILFALLGLAVHRMVEVFS